MNAGNPLRSAGTAPPESLGTDPPASIARLVVSGACHQTLGDRASMRAASFRLGPGAERPCAALHRAGHVADRFRPAQGRRDLLSPILRFGVARISGGAAAMAEWRRRDDRRSLGLRRARVARRGAALAPAPARIRACSSQGSGQPGHSRADPALKVRRRPLCREASPSPIPIPPFRSNCRKRRIPRHLATAASI